MNRYLQPTISAFLLDEPALITATLITRRALKLWNESDLKGHNQTDSYNCIVSLDKEKSKLVPDWWTVHWFLVKLNYKPLVAF